MAETTVREYFSDGLIILVVLLVFGLLGGWAGATTFLLLLFFTSRSTPLTLIDTVISIITLAPAEAALVGGTTFVVGVVFVIFLFEDLEQALWSTGKIFNYIIYLGIVSLTSIIGIFTAVVIHAGWIWYTTNSVTEQIIAVVSELRLAFLQMLFVGFFSPYLFLFTVLIIILLVSGVSQLNRLRRSWPFLF